MGPVCVALGALGVLASAYATSITGQANVQIVTGQLTVTVVDDLQFGSLDAGTQDGEVELTTSNVRTVTVPDVSLQGSNFHRAEFTVTGPTNTQYDILLPPSGTSENTEQTAERDESGNPESTLLVVQLTAFSVNAGLGTIGETDGNGIDTVYVGGTLLVPTTAKQGNYRGDVALTVTFH